VIVKEAAIHFAYKVTFVSVTKVPAGETAYAVPPVPDAVVYQLSNVNPSLTKFPLFVETVNGETEPVTKLPLAGTVPPVAPFPL
jgi:hypothetical protein